MTRPYDIVILGLSITSSWGNGHATTYRSLVRGLASRNWRILFLERDAPWYAGNRDEPCPPGCRTEIYESVDDLTRRFEAEVSGAGLVIVGSFVPDGTPVGEWALSIAKGVTAFYDIDTPVTLESLARASNEYITADLVRRYQIYLSFTGGPILQLIENQYGSPMARPLYCSVDPEQYRPVEARRRWDLGYLGTYSEDRQPVLDRLMLAGAREWRNGRFIVAGPMYPEAIEWPPNVEREIHLSPREHPGFYGSQRFTLNVTREAMKAAGFSPSVRLFEAAACGVPVISDWWDGLDTILEPEKEILVAAGSEDTLRYLRDYPEAQRQAIGAAARRRILAEHTPRHRALQLESYWREAHDNLSVDSAWRYRRGRQGAGGFGAGVAPQPAWETAGRTACGPAGEHQAECRVHEPPGTGC